MAQTLRARPQRPIVLQVSRFDRFKDPVGVIRAYRHGARPVPVQLVLAGGGADDDPEGAAVLAAVREAAGDDPDIHVLLLPARRAPHDQRPAAPWPTSCCRSRCARGSG